MFALWLAACAKPCLVPDEDLVGAVSLPADEAPHDEPVEWWYWTGHLQDDDGRWYGFEETIFVFRLGVFDGTVSNAALTEVDDDRFSYGSKSADALPDVGGDGFSLTAGDDHVEGGGGHDVLAGHTPDASFALDATAAVSAVFQHGDGYVEYDVGGYSWYYSRPRMDVTGTVTVDGEDRAVSGMAWMDHQWGNLVPLAQSGWDWFALQLNDGRDVMLFMTQGGDGMVGGTVSDHGCEPRELGADEVAVTATGTWTSPATGCTYPSGWEVRVGDETFVVTPAREDQELASDEQTYWEGASLVSGDADGRAYVELAGYCN